MVIGTQLIKKRHFNKSNLDPGDDVPSLKIVFRQKVGYTILIKCPLKLIHSLSISVAESHERDGRFR